MDKTYSIYEHRFQSGAILIAEGLTLEEAQEHCSREDTHGDGPDGLWFHGYEEE
jgi:hypothetical protein